MSIAREERPPPRAGDHQLTRGGDGYFLYNRNDVYIGRSIEAYGEFSGAEGDFLTSLLQNGDIVVEAGANIGAHSVAIAKKIGNAGRLFAFEPQRLAFQLLCANIALNNLTNVEAYWMAVGAQIGTVLVPELDPGRENNFGGVSIGTGQPGQPVPCCTLDGFMRVDRLRLIKADVEGMETDVLAGARSLITSRRPLLYVENDRPTKSPGLITLIQSLGYDAYWHLPPLFRPDNHRRNGENLFPNVVSLNLFCVPKEQNANPPTLTPVVGPFDRPH